jgi:hypothetical protein
MTEEEFSRLALSLPEAVASSHHGQPDFRVRGKIFATTGYGDGAAVLKLTREQQEMVVEAEPAIFRPVRNSYGAKGWTNIVLVAADEATARSGLAAAWKTVAPKSLVEANPEL